MRNKIKVFLKNPIYVAMGIIICVIILSLTILSKKAEVEEYIDENFTQTINIDSNGNGNIYVRDGIIVSFHNVYSSNNYIALQVSLKNDTGKEITVNAEIPEINEKITFTSDKNHYEYILIGDSQSSKYAVNLEIKSEKHTLAEGVVNVTHTMENSTIMTENNIIYFSDNLEIYYLGTSEQSIFLQIDNKNAQDKKISFENDEGGFVISAKGNTNDYMYITGVGALNMAVGTYDITVENINIEEDIIIEEVDGTE